MHYATHCFFVNYSVPQSVLAPMIGWLVSDELERIWSKLVFANRGTILRRWIEETPTGT